LDSQLVGTGGDGGRHAGPPVRLPSFVVPTEIVRAEGESLTPPRPGESPAPYVAGTLLAIRSVQGRVGLTGLDALRPDFWAPHCLKSSIFET
jgi:hypothetical protein